MFLKPSLITFDIFGTVLDWRTGLENACAAAGRPLHDGEFDRIVDAQSVLEHGPFSSYTTITQDSLAGAIALHADQAAGVAASIGAWPLYPDAQCLRDIMHVAPCAAMTNSDRCHGAQIQARLGFQLSDWLCAEDTRVYKPNPEFWHSMARRRGVLPGPDWWHVSAYADYDLAVANDLRLTTVFVQRPHSRPGDATHAVQDLHGLLSLLTKPA